MDNVEDFSESQKKVKGVNERDRFLDEFTQEMKEIRGNYQQLNNLLIAALDAINCKPF